MTDFVRYLRYALWCAEQGYPVASYRTWYEVTQLLGDYERR